MKHYRDPDNKVHILEDESFSYLLPPGCEPISPEEAAVLQVVPPPSEADLLKAEIVDLEATITPRRLREALLGTDGGWLARVDKQITDLRGQLAP